MKSNCHSLCLRTHICQHSPAWSSQEVLQGMWVQKPESQKEKARVTDKSAVWMCVCVSLWVVWVISWVETGPFTLTHHGKHKSWRWCRSTCKPKSAVTTCCITAACHHCDSSWKKWMNFKRETLLLLWMWNCAGSAWIQHVGGLIKPAWNCLLKSIRWIKF